MHRFQAKKSVRICPIRPIRSLIVSPFVKIRKIRIFFPKPKIQNNFPLVSSIKDNQQILFLICSIFQ
jgi:hypothetical protein